MKRISTIIRLMPLFLVGTMIVPDSARGQYPVDVSPTHLSFDGTAVSPSPAQYITITNWTDVNLWVDIDIPPHIQLKVTESDGWESGHVFFPISMNPVSVRVVTSESITLNDSLVIANKVVYITGDVPLPVELSAFTIKNAKNINAELDWTTISEKNNLGFYVQKSADGETNFITLGFVPGSGTSLSAHEYSYTDNVAPFTSYRLKQVDLDGSVHCSSTISLAAAGTATMSTPKLDQNYPNPFNPATRISFTIAKEGPVSLRVYDILGREAATLVNEKRKPGEYAERFDGSRFASGVYMYVLQTAQGRISGRMVLTK